MTAPKDTVQLIIAEMHAMTDEVETVKRMAGHAACNGWGIGGEPYGARCGCGLPFDDLADAARRSVTPDSYPGELAD